MSNIDKINKRKQKKREWIGDFYLNKFRLLCKNKKVTVTLIVNYVLSINSL